MRKVIVGIALVVCLDAAFILLTRLTNENSAVARLLPAPVRTILPRSAMTPDADEQDVAALKTSEDRDPFARSDDNDVTDDDADRFSSGERAGEPAVYRRGSFREKLTAAPQKFETVTISYDDGSRLTAKDFGPKKIERTAVAQQPAEKKRSTIVRIVKAPYNLLKSAVSVLR